MPPLSTSAWTGLTVTGLSNPPYGDVPQNVRWVVPWAGGYVAVTSWTWEEGAMGVWESPDGRTWTEQPASLFALDDPSPNRLGFDLERVMRTPYRIDDFQQTYFVIPSLEALLAATLQDFAPLYARLGAAADIPIETVLPDERAFTVGTQAYAQSRLSPARQ